MRALMTRTVGRLSALSCVLVCITLAGCSAFGSKKTRGEAPAGHTLKTETTPSAQLDLPPPKAVLDHGAVRMTGVARRKPGYDGPVTGALLITVSLPTGAVSGQILRRFGPEFDVPVVGPRSLEYPINYVCLPPSDALVTIEHFPSLVTLLEEGGPEGTGNGAASGGGAFRARAARAMNLRGRGFARPSGRAFSARGSSRRK